MNNDTADRQSHSRGGADEPAFAVLEGMKVLFDERVGLQPVRLVPRTPDTDDEGGHAARSRSRHR
jgi:hypothetical protein